MKNINIEKQEIISFLFILACIMLYVIFPAKDNFQYKIVAFVFFILIPYVYSRYILKSETIINKINLKGNWKNSIYWTLGSILTSLLLVAIVFRFSNLLDHYPLSTDVRKNFWHFLSYELLGVSFTVALYELFFRGFAMSILEKKIGKWSIVVQAVLFYIMLLIIYVPFAFSYLYIIFVPFAGLIAYKTRSILYSFVGQLLFIIIADASAIALLSKMQ